MAPDHDHALRLAAFAHCEDLMRAYAGMVPWSAIQQGFAVAGERVYLANKARGIHRPRQMQRGALSIKTTRPRRGRTARYDD